MKKFLSVIIMLSLTVSLFPFPVVSIQEVSDLTLTVKAVPEKVAVGDEIKITISMGDTFGMDLSSFSFCIQLPDGLKLKTGSGAIAMGFQSVTGMFMATFDETPLLMASGFGDNAYNGGSIDIATFICIAETAGTYKVELFNVNLYSIDILQITGLVVPVFITVEKDNKETYPQENESDNPKDNNVVADETNDDTSYPIQKHSEWVNPFSDVKLTDWFYDYVAIMHTNGIMVGTSQAEFSPNTPVTRAMFVRILANFDEIDLSVYRSSYFSDVPTGQWYSAAIEWAAEMEIVSGIGNGKFDPNANITREQMAVMLNNYIRYKSITFPINHTQPSFADESQISSWAIDAVKAIQSAGIIYGKPGNLYDPKTTAMRSEVATIFARFIKSTR